MVGLEYVLVWEDVKMLYEKGVVGVVENVLGVGVGFGVSIFF